MTKPKPAPLDDVSKAIIAELQEGRPTLVRRHRQGRRSLKAAVRQLGAAPRRRRRDAGRRGHRPRRIGFARQAMIGIKATGELRPIADALAELDEVDYVVITAGSFDVLAEVVCERRPPSLQIISRGIRTIPGVISTRDAGLPAAAQTDLLLEVR